MTRTAAPAATDPVSLALRVAPAARPAYADGCRDAALFVYDNQLWSVLDASWSGTYALRAAWNAQTTASDAALARALLAEVPFTRALESLVLAEAGEDRFLDEVDERLRALGFEYPGEIPCDCLDGGVEGHHFACGFVHPDGRRARDFTAEILVPTTAGGTRGETGA